MNFIKPPEKRIEFTFDGESVIAYAGQTVGAALLDHGIRTLRKTRGEEKSRGIFCGIGVCFDCLVVVNGLPNQRACLLEVQDRMIIEMQRGVGNLP